MFENMAHVMTAGFMPAPEEMISGNSALKNLKSHFLPFYWRPRESNYEGVDAVLRYGDQIWALQYIVSRSHRAATDGLTEVYKNMNLIYKFKWPLVMIGATRSEADSARDSQKLTKPWNEISVYSCVVQLGAFDQERFQQLQEVFDDVSKR
jgi:hypothetical protein